MIHLRQPLHDLGCQMCDRGHMRICFEHPNTNPLHIYGADLFKCCLPDCVYMEERKQEEKGTQ